MMDTKKNRIDDLSPISRHYCYIDGRPIITDEKNKNEITLYDTVNELVWCIYELNERIKTLEGKIIKAGE